ncbi:MAG: NAD-dependent epimerase/dehydratase family protein [Planctomycetes bacterium]|nr:NAD-dependent epimerase/dehydratase family protein [Planctomycetota bacterium]
MGARILVTGAAGVIGFELARQIAERGDELVAIDCGKKGGLEDLDALAAKHTKRVTVLHDDLALGRLDLDGRFDAIFHLAAIVGVKYVTDHPYETMVVNMRSTLNVLDFALRSNSGPFFFASSSENYASGVDAGFVKVPTPEDVILSIDRIALPRWSYAASKLAGESAVFGAASEHGLHPIVVRFHNVYGPRMGQTHVIPEMLQRVRERVDPFPIYGADQTRSFLYVEDAGRALLTVLDAALAGASGLFNIGSPHERRIDELARTIFDVTGFHPKLDLHPAPPGSVARRAPDLAKLSALGFAPRFGLEDGLRTCWKR